MKGPNNIPAALPAEWVRAADCESSGCIEVLDEQDGNWLVRSSFNRDRTLRLTREEVSQLVGVALFGRTAPAPESVG